MRIAIFSAVCGKWKELTAKNRHSYKNSRLSSANNVTAENTANKM